MRTPAIARAVVLFAALLSAPLGVAAQPALADPPANVAPTPREFAAAKVRQLAVLIEARVVARREADRTAAQLERMSADLSAGELAKFDAALQRGAAEISQLEIELAVTAETPEHPRHKAIATRLKAQREAYELRTTKVRAVAAAAVAQAKRDDDAAQARLAEVTKLAEGAERALLDLVAK